MIAPELKAPFRIALLKRMDSNRTRWGLRLAELKVLVTVDGFHGVTDDEALDALDYWIRHGGCVEEVLKTANRGDRSWRITPAGIDWLDENSP